MRNYRLVVISSTEHLCSINVHGFHPNFKQNICWRSCIDIKRRNMNFECNIVALLSSFSMDMMNCVPFEYGNFWGNLLDQSVRYIWYLQPNSPVVPNTVWTSEEHYFPFEDEFHRCLCLGCDKGFWSPRGIITLNFHLYFFLRWETRFPNIHFWQ